MTLKDYLSESPFSLSLSSGFFGFFAHAGFMLALEEEKLLPTRISGSSAGAIMASVGGFQLSMQKLILQLLLIKRNDFWDPFPGFGFLRGFKFRELLWDIFGRVEIENSKIPLHISAFNIFRQRTEVLSLGCLAKAINASCAVPIMFHPVKFNNIYYWDGGILDVPGIEVYDKQEKVFCHYLVQRKVLFLKDSTNPMFTKNPNLVALSIENLPEIGPFKLENGEKIIEMTYKRSLLALKSPYLNKRHLIV